MRALQVTLAETQALAGFGGRDIYEAVSELRITDSNTSSTTLEANLTLNNPSSFVLEVAPRFRLYPAGAAASAVIATLSVPGGSLQAPRQSLYDVRLGATVGILPPRNVTRGEYVEALETNEAYLTALIDAHLDGNTSALVLVPTPNQSPHAILGPYSHLLQGRRYPTSLPPSRLGRLALTGVDVHCFDIVLDGNKVVERTLSRGEVRVNNTFGSTIEVLRATYTVEWR